jgi:tryptophanyl-tRNA synthetase
MNSEYGTGFPEPKRYSIVAKDFTIPSILGKGKMSKSKKGTAIFLSDGQEEVVGKISGMPTDNGKGDAPPKEGDKAYPFFQLYGLILGEVARKRMEEEYVRGGVIYSDEKKKLSQGINEMLSSLQKERKKYTTDKVEEVLKEGAVVARKIASKTLLEVKEKMGLK